MPIASAGRPRRAGLGSGDDARSVGATTLNRLKIFGLMVLLPLVILGLAGLIFVGLGQATPAERPQPGTDLASLVKALPAAEAAQILPYDARQQTLDVLVSGTVVPYRQLTVPAEVAGRIAFKSENCRAGRYVMAGELLYRIDDRDFRLEVSRLSGLRDQEYNQLRELDQEQANLQESLQLAEEEIALLEREILRLRQLPAGVTSQSDLDQAERMLLAGRNQRLTLRNQERLLLTRRKRLELAEQLAQTQLEQAQLNLARTEIRAPISGVVVRDPVEVDAYVQTGTLLCEIDDTEQVEVVCDLRMDQLYWVLSQSDPDLTGPDQLVVGGGAMVHRLPQTPVTVRFEVAGRASVYQWEGFLSRYDGTGVDPQSRTVPCRVTVPEPRRFLYNAQPVDRSKEAGPGNLVRGMFVELIIHTRPRVEMLLIPKLALKPGGSLWRFVDDPSVVQPSEAVTSGLGPSPTIGPAEDSTGGLFARLRRLVGWSDSETSGFGMAEPLGQAGTSRATWDLQQWQWGRVEVLRGISAVRDLRSRIGDSPSEVTGYWIIEQAQGLKAGDWLITSPMVGLRYDGTDRVRILKASPPAPLDLGGSTAPTPRPVQREPLSVIEPSQTPAGS
jgi:multidrug efflux pump subunit AcrA (membrane-fusion protein)